MKPEYNAHYCAVADQVVPRYRGEGPALSCSGHIAKQWSAAYEGARLAMAAQPSPAEVDALIAEIAPLVEKVASPNGWDWMFPIKVVPVDGKPTIASHKGGNLFRGYIATWGEADLLVALANAAPRILAALRASTPTAQPTVAL